MKEKIILEILEKQKIIRYIPYFKRAMSAAIDEAIYEKNKEIEKLIEFYELSKKVVLDFQSDRFDETLYSRWCDLREQIGYSSIVAQVLNGASQQQPNHGTER